MQKQKYEIKQQMQHKTKQNLKDESKTNRTIK